MKKARGKQQGEDLTSVILYGVTEGLALMMGITSPMYCSAADCSALEA